MTFDPDIWLVLKMTDSMIFMSSQIATNGWDWIDPQIHILCPQMVIDVLDGIELIKAIM